MMQGSTSVPKVVGISFRPRTEQAQQEDKARQRGDSAYGSLDQVNSRDAEAVATLQDSTSINICNEGVCSIRNRGAENKLSLVGITLKVTYREGSWWKGCCLRNKISKDVLEDINLQLTSGQLTAILGNSGNVLL